MPGVKIYCRAISEEEAEKIRKSTQRWYQAGAIFLGAGVMIYATESVVRNVGGIEYAEIARNLFETAGYLSIGGLIISLSNFMAGPQVISSAGPSNNDGIEGKL